MTTTPPRPSRELRPMPTMQDLQGEWLTVGWNLFYRQSTLALEDRLRLALELLNVARCDSDNGDERDNWDDEYDRLLASLPEAMK